MPPAATDKKPAAATKGKPKTNQSVSSHQGLPNPEEGWKMDKIDEFSLDKFHVPLAQLLERSRCSVVQEHCTKCLQLGELDKEGLIELQEDDTVPQPKAAADGGTEEEQGTKEKHRTIAVDVEVSLHTICINSTDQS